MNQPQPEHTVVDGTFAATDDSNHQHVFDQICRIARKEYGSVSPLLIRLYNDVNALYAGHWTSHEACEVSYHDFSHALDVVLATARMTAGWNRTDGHVRIPEEIFLCGLGAAFFHDAGYIKDKGDLEGHGGKYTFTHVERSMELAHQYLLENHWSPYAIGLIPRIIAITDYNEQHDMAALFAAGHELVIAKIVATSDLVAQMADIDYTLRIKDLYQEFKEVYEFESPKALEERGAHVYKSVEEVVNGTISFYEDFVVPQLQRFGRMDRYLGVYFGEGRNPYLENIAANLSSQLMSKNATWRRLGDILTELGLVSDETLDRALAQQKHNGASGRDHASNSIRKKLLPWLNSHYECNCLGDILLEMGAIDSEALCQGLLSQLLPDDLAAKLTRNELLFLVRVSLLLQNICKGPWILGQIMEMTNKLLPCEASSIFVAKPDSEEMLVSLPTGPKRKFLLGKVIPIDKGLAGWVYRHHRPAIVAQPEKDARFDVGTDRQVGFETRSILAVPLLVNGECIGVVEALNKIGGPFSEHDMHLLVILTNMMSISLGGILYLQNL